MTDLHARLVAAVNARLEVARAADIAPELEAWYSVLDLTKGHQDGGAGLFALDAKHIALNDPATVIRHCERDLRVLERHVPVHIGGPAACKHAWVDSDGWIEDYPCDDLRDLATAYGMELSP
jgi:hypothetical protein